MAGNETATVINNAFYDELGERWYEERVLRLLRRHALKAQDFRRVGEVAAPAAAHGSGTGTGQAA